MEQMEPGVREESSRTASQHGVKGIDASEGRRSSNRTRRESDEESLEASYGEQ